MSARVLVVDDILPNIKLLEAKLSAAYYDVITATNGPDALEKIVSEDPDLVLLDVMMPGMDGFEVCEKIKENPETSHIPVVMVTALTDTADRVRGLEAGADDFLSKPLNDTALMARVRSLVRLKMTVDEWRIRENTAMELGVRNEGANLMNEPADHARVLLVEDQAFERDKFSETLKQDEDIVITAANGIEAMELAAGHDDIELLIVSLNLAEEDALRLCSHLKSNDRTRYIPILIVSDEADMDRIAHALEIGVQDYVLRPVDRNELLARVRTQIRRKRFTDHLRSNYEVSLSMALIDSLTGLYNRRYLVTHLEKLLKKAPSSQRPLGVLMADIDHFKQINDTYGHNVGDEVLKEFSDRLKENLRGFDLIARLGGEEFVAILPDVNPETAMIISERLRDAIAKKPFSVTHDETNELTVTMSVGGVIVSGEGNTVESVLSRADDQLYKAKDDGRNVVHFEDIGRLDAHNLPAAERRFAE